MEDVNLHLIESNIADGFQVLDPKLSPAKVDNTQTRALLEDKIKNIDQKILELTTEKDKYLSELSLIADEKTTDAIRNNASVVKRKSKDKKGTQIIDIIAAMKKGTQILKYGAWGAPHYHQFELTPDSVFLRWYSKKKKRQRYKTAIKIENIIHFQKGHLYKQEQADSRAHKRAFSISYTDVVKNEAKTLEVVAKTKTDYEIWTKGLEYVLRKIRKVKKQDIAYDPKMHFPKETYMEIHKRDQRAYEHGLKKKEDPTPEAMAKSFKLLVEKFEATEDLLSVVIKTRNSENYGSMDSIMVAADRIKELKVLKEEISEHLKAKSKKLSILSYQTYDINVEIKALEEKLLVLQ